MLKLILKHKIRTGLGARAILQMIEDIPKGVTEKSIINLLSGRPSLIEKEAQRTILSVLEKAPDKTVLKNIRFEDKTSGSRRANRVSITSEIYDKIDDEFKRTGINLQHVMKYAPEHSNKPSAGTVNRICSKRLKTICGQKLDFILRQYKQWPENKEGTKQHYAVAQSSYEPIPQKSLEEIGLYRDMLNLLPGHIFKVCDDAPEGLTAHMISGWLNGTTKNANPEYVSWVLKSCREVVKRVYEQYQS